MMMLMLDNKWRWGASLFGSTLFDAYNNETYRENAMRTQRMTNDTTRGLCPKLAYRNLIAPSVELHIAKM